MTDYRQMWKVPPPKGSLMTGARAQVDKYVKPNSVAF